MGPETTNRWPTVPETTSRWQMVPETTNRSEMAAARRWAKEALTASIEKSFPTREPMQPVPETFLPERTSLTENGCG